MPTFPLRTSGTYPIPLAPTRPASPWTFAAAGAAIGLLVPVAAWLLDAWWGRVPLQPGMLAALHAANPLHWLIDATPFAFGGAAWQVGRSRRQRHAAQREGRFYESVLATVDCLVVVLDQHGRVLRLNRGAELITGAGEWEARGRMLWEMFLEGDEALRVRTLFSVHPSEWLPHRAESAWRTIHGTSRLVAWSATTAPAPAGSAPHVIVTGVDVTERRRLEEQLAHRAFHDPLTDLSNRLLFHERVTAALGRMRPGEPRVAVLFLDLDDFKLVNDSLGHAAGDRLLQAAAVRLLNATRGCDAVARLGGDEFAILLEGVREEREVVIVAERVARAMRAPFPLEGREVHVGTSIGIALAEPERSTDELLRDADLAMYLAKSGGKGRYALFVPGMQVASFERLELETDLRAAVDEERFTVHFQPIVRLENGALAGMEALLRWHHPERGTVPPSEFIPLAEETGLIVPLGRWVLREACRQAQAWRDRHPAADELTLAVNLSPRQFQDPHLVADVRAALLDSGFPASQLVLEITESGLMKDIRGTLETLRALKALGLTLAIDDFGTGYSSLGYLQRFPVDILKIDKAFVESVGTGGDEPVLARTIIFLSGTLGLRVVAEGIEHSRQVEGLRFLGCELGQGFHYAPALPP
ncbi:MAG TPA: EAL domain-containing protein, partial [Gemmatimonadaceae bacterium]|nr:EAL domain-containing protein [Gemmatimonadaceae bacterium]